MARKQSRVTLKGAVIELVVIIAFLAAYPVALYTSERVELVRVDDKESVVGGGYIVFAPDQEYKVKDSWLYWTFNSSRRYNQLDEGDSYACRVVGWRIPFLSMYPNVIEVIDSDE